MTDGVVATVGAASSAAVTEVGAALADLLHARLRAVGPVPGPHARTSVEDLLIVLHVFNETTVPRFWDQPAHAPRDWGDEFLARYCPHPGVRPHLRTCAPGEHVLSVAADEDVDLITLGWPQRLDPNRARTVRQTVAQASVPEMLMPVSRPAAGEPAGRGFRGSG